MFYPDLARIAQVDIRPEALGNRCPLELGVLGGVKETIAALLPVVAEKTDANHLEIQGCVLGFLCGGETWTRVGPPIPSSPVNSMAKGPSKPGAAPAPKMAAAAPATKTTGAAVGAAPKPGAARCGQ